MSRAWISESLDAAQLAHTWDGDVAVLDVQLPNRPRLSLTARHTGDVLQLIAHRVLVEPFSAQLVADRDVLNQEWSLGRVYFSERAAAWDASIGLYAPQRAAAGNAVLAAIGALADAPASIARGMPPAFHVEPVRTPAEVMPSVEQALRASGFDPVAKYGGEVMAVSLQLDQIKVQVEWFVANGSLVVARAQPAAPQPLVVDAPLLERMNGLLGRLDIGGVGIWHEHGIAYAWIAHPIPWFDTASVRWSSERAGSWAEAAQLLTRG